MTHYSAVNVRPYLDKTPQLGRRVYIDPAATVIGEVVIGDDSSVWPGTVIRGDIHFIHIGKRTNIQDGSVLHVTRRHAAQPDGWPLIIGDDVTVGHKVCLHGCTLGNRILVGIGAVVLDGVEIPDEVVIGAGTLVPPGKKLESGYLYIGSPCKQSRPLKDKEIDYLNNSPNNYVKLKDEFMQQFAQPA